MSKSKGNALDPVDLIQKYGADSLRWALVVDSAPWNSKRFSERIVQEAKSKLVDTLDNVYSFYVLYANLDGYDPEKDYVVKKNKLDDWILSRLHSTIKIARVNLEDYHFTNAAREIAKLVEEVSNWYVRRSRERFWASDMSPDKAAAYQTLHEVLTRISQLVAPLTPFIAEDIYFNLTGESVHLSDYPAYDPSLINEQLEHEMEAALQVVELGRSIRNTTSLKVKQPLASISVLSAATTINWKAYEDIIMDELNVKQFHEVDDEDQFAAIKLKLDFKKSGAKFGKQSNIIHTWLQQLTSEESMQFTELGYGEMSTSSGKLEKVTIEDVLIEKIAKEGYSSATNGEFTVTLDVALTKELIQEGMARELIRAIQGYRKELNLPINMRIDIVVCTDETLQEVIRKFEFLLQENVLMRNLCMKDHVVEGLEIKVGEHTALIQLMPIS